MRIVCTTISAAAEVLVLLLNVTSALPTLRRSRPARHAGGGSGR